MTDVPPVTALNDANTPVHPFVPAVWFDVAFTLTAPPAADSLYAEYNWLNPAAVTESSRVYPEGSVHVTAELAGRCSRKETTFRFPAVAFPVTVHVVVADAVPVP